MMRIIASGDRHWTDFDFVYRVFQDRYPRDTQLIHGDNGNDDGTHGLDRIAARAAALLFDHTPIAAPAEWQVYGLAAGPRRNGWMLRNYGTIHEVIAFHDDIRSSKGTKDMLAQAERMGIPTLLCTHHSGIPAGQGRLF
jgi:hypothetical protein